MRSYESLVVFPIGGTAEVARDGKNPFEETVKKHGGKILNRSELGRRLLGYRVKKATEGYFINFSFELEPSQMDALKRSLNLIEEILKFTIIVKPKLEPGRPVRQTSGHVVHAGEKR